MLNLIFDSFLCCFEISLPSVKAKSWKNKNKSLAFIVKLYDKFQYGVGIESLQHVCCFVGAALKILN